MEKLLNTIPEKSHAYVWNGVLLYAPKQISNQLHAHFASTVLIAVDRPFQLTMQDGSSRSYEVALLAPNVPRATDSCGAALVDFLIDPDDDLYRYLHPVLAGEPLVGLQAERLSDFRTAFAKLFSGEMDCKTAHALVVDVLAALNPSPLAALPWDSRVQQANHYMRTCLPGHVPSIPEVAAEVGLSQSRFMHLFREQMGLPVRQYLLWLRIRHAMRYWAQGKTLSETALAAGFYDQAHFTRTIRRMTDYAPSMLSDPENIHRVDCSDC